jgi:hypothetical protein
MFKQTLLQLQSRSKFQIVNKPKFSHIDLPLTVYKQKNFQINVYLFHEFG